MPVRSPEHSALCTPTPEAHHLRGLTHHVERRAEVNPALR